MAKKQPTIIDGATGEALPLPVPSRYRAKLDTIHDVKREIAKVYREARSGVVDVQDATKLTWCLQALGKVIEGSDIEKRIELLEKAHER